MGAWSVVAGVLVVALCGCVSVHAAVDADEITSLPGWDGPLPSRMWSGYFQIPGNQGNKYYHYWFVESEGNPKTDPVALWLNGGPGSSSLIGLLTENGPFMLNDDSLPNPLQVCGCNVDQINTCQSLGMQCGCGVNGTTCTHDDFGTCTSSCPAPGGVPVPKLIHRTTGWQTAANYIFLESPAGVGFSYCDYSNCTNSDTSTAIDNHLVLKAFFAAFPEYASNDFYITGESYAGIYIPTLAEQIMNDPDNKINLKGLAVGNGCWGSAVGLCAFGADMYRIQAQFFLGVGAISKNLYKQISKACGDPALGPGTWPDPLPAPCQALINQMNAVTGDYEVYNYFDTCYGGSGIQESFEERINRYRSGEAFGAGDSARLRRGASRSGKLGGAVNDYVCGGELAMSIWLALPEVAAALHVRTGKSGMTYGPRDRGDLRPLYKTLAQKYRVTIYSGDVDACVPHVGTEEWTSQLGFPVAEDWRPWLAGTPEDVNATITAGYVTTYAATPTNNFTFITIKGAGHMVPEFKPVSALAFIQRFFANSGY